MNDRRKEIREEINSARLRTILLDLLDIYSPSGKEEDVQLYLEDLFHREGFAVQRQAVEEDRYNLRITMGREEPGIYLVGHVDTVAAWDLEEFGPREEGDIVRGLGSADMKGGCAAMVEAFLALASVFTPEERPSVGLLLAVGEEENGDGSARFLEEHRPEWVVIGEPTSMAACFSHFGYLEAGFVTRGRRTHSSLPELGHNAVESMLRVLLHLGRDPLFKRKNSGIVYSIREMGSAQAGFVVPDRCESWIDLHLPPGADPSLIEESIRRRAASSSRFIPELNLEVDFNFSSRGFDLGTENAPADLLREIFERENLPLRFDSFRSHSDGNLFFQAGVNPVILGPGALETAHTPDEQTSMIEVEAAARIYAALCCGYSAIASKHP